MTRQPKKELEEMLDRPLSLSLRPESEQTLYKHEVTGLELEHKDLPNRDFPPHKPDLPEKQNC